jgi:3-hydroxyacyl-[acyl-carrier-protein] dehydratase
LSTAEGTRERAAIEARIQHRAPFLFLDRIVELDGASVLAEWRVPEDADWFRGHFPGEPVTPGVILCEHVFQAGTVLVAEACAPSPAPALPSLAPTHPGDETARAPRGGGKLPGEIEPAPPAGVPVLARIERARFRRVVRPGELLSTRVRLAERVGPAFVLEGEVRCGGERALEISFTVAQSGALARATGV